MCHTAEVKANKVEDRDSTKKRKGQRVWEGEGECQTRAAGAERLQRKWGGSVPCDYFLGHRAWPSPSGANQSILDNFLKHLNLFPALQHPKNQVSHISSSVHLSFQLSHCLLIFNFPFNVSLFHFNSFYIDQSQNFILLQLVAQTLLRMGIQLFPLDEGAWSEYCFYLTIHTKCVLKTYSALIFWPTSCLTQAHACIFFPSKFFVPEISSCPLGFPLSSDNSGYILGKTSRKTCKDKDEDTCSYRMKERMKECVIIYNSSPKERVDDVGAFGMFVNINAIPVLTSIPAV